MTKIRLLATVCSLGLLAATPVFAQSSSTLASPGAAGNTTAPQQSSGAVTGNATSGNTSSGNPTAAGTMPGSAMPGSSGRTMGSGMPSSTKASPSAAGNLTAPQQSSGGITGNSTSGNTSSGNPYPQGTDRGAAMGNRTTRSSLPSSTQASPGAVGNSGMAPQQSSGGVTGNSTSGNTSAGNMPGTAGDMGRHHGAMGSSGRMANMHGRGAVSGDNSADRLNDQSLQAAQQGTAYRSSESTGSGMQRSGAGGGRM